jgi:zinc transport system substrate-binding protein
MKRILIVLIAATLLAATLGCKKQQEKQVVPAPAAANHKLSVVTTLFPLFDFARNIAGDKAEVTLLLPPGVEPHSFEPKPEDVVRISKTDVLVYTNEFMEPWAVKLLTTIATKPEVVDSSRGVTLLKASPEEEHEPGAATEHHHHGGVDPHIWLDFGNAQIMVQNIADGMGRRDPANRDYYLSHAAAYQKELQKLDDDFKAGLANCGTRVLLHGGHYAFGYLAGRYDLSYHSAQAINPDAEPTPQKIAELVKEMRANSLKYVYCEELLSHATAETIARETGAKVLVLNGAHNVSKEDFDKGVSFIALMRLNLENLRKGLQCR